MIGVIHKVRFVTSGSTRFRQYINYIKRATVEEDSNYKEFSLYNDYMGNPKKLGSLFTSGKDSLDKKEVDTVKKLFSEAQKKKSVMWQDVFSFDNRFLEEHKLYDKRTHSVDEAKIKLAVRSAMNELIKKENFTSLVWSGSIHYNTDNIHVHIASVEVNPSRERGKRKPKTLVYMKSKFINSLIDRSAGQTHEKL